MVGVGGVCSLPTESRGPATEAAAGPNINHKNQQICKLLKDQLHKKRVGKLIFLLQDAESSHIKELLEGANLVSPIETVHSYLEQRGAAKTRSRF